MTAVAPLLSARDVECEFAVGRGIFRRPELIKALRGISIEIGRGEILGIVGESGSGKSTLAKILLGLQAPTSGFVELLGHPLTEFDRRQRARLVQAVFQDPASSLNPRQTIEAIVGMPLNVLAIGDRRERHSAVARMIELVGLPAQCLGVHSGQLSGGQRQRVAIARALVLRPSVLICDEPTSALDVSVQAQIVNLLRGVSRELGTSMIVISHNLAVVAQMASRVAVMYLGRIVEAGPTSRIFGDPQHPYTQALLLSFLPAQAGRALPDLRLRGQFPSPFELPPGCAFHPRCPIATEVCARSAPAASVHLDRAIECHHREWHGSARREPPTDYEGAMTWRRRAPMPRTITLHVP
ncbi:MAG: oligopeptide/dipeptide ABC transporter ATP-binding protein [Hyphomicrobiales bacterium]